MWRCDGDIVLGELLHCLVDGGLEGLPALHHQHHSFLRRAAGEMAGDFVDRYDGLLSQSQPVAASIA